MTIIKIVFLNHFWLFKLISANVMTKNKSFKKKQFKFEIKFNFELEILQTIEWKIKQFYRVILIINHDQCLDNLKIVDENQSIFTIKIELVNLEKWKIYINMHLVMQIMRIIHLLENKTKKIENVSQNLRSFETELRVMNCRRFILSC